MLKRIFIIISLLIILLFISCNTNMDNIEIGNNGPFEVKYGESKILDTQTVYIYYYDNYVEKTIYKEKITLSQNGDLEDLKNYAETNENTFSLDMFQVDGFNYSSQLNDTSFTSEITIDYT